MDWLEQELKSAMARQDPPADFAERVLREAARAQRRPAFHGARWLAAAAALVMTAGAGLGYRQYRGEVAKDQVMQALKIASTQVNRIQTHVREVAR